MNTTVVEHLELPEQGLAKESKIDTIRQHKAYGPAFNLLISGLLILAGVVVLKATGLYDGMESVLGKISLLAVVSSGYLIAFRRGFYAG